MASLDKLRLQERLNEMGSQTTVDAETTRMPKDDK